jgi:hypothetical protein
VWHGAQSGLVRCAIYTRKSTEEGLEQEFNSLEALYTAGQALEGREVADPPRRSQTADSC